MSSEDEWRATCDQFTAELGELIDKWWQRIGPDSDRQDDPLDAVAVAEMGSVFPSCWVLVVGADSLSDPHAASVSSRFSPKGQSPFTGIGLLADALATWTGVDA